MVVSCPNSWLAATSNCGSELPQRDCARLPEDAMQSTADLTLSDDASGLSLMWAVRCAILLWFFSLSSHDSSLDVSAAPKGAGTGARQIAGSRFGSAPP